jgi:hypothetical protein
VAAGGSYSLVSRAVLSLVLLLAAVPAASASRAGGEISHCRTFGVIPPTDRSAQPRDLDLKMSYSPETSVTGGQVRWTSARPEAGAGRTRCSSPRPVPRCEESPRFTQVGWPSS